MSRKGKEKYYVDCVKNYHLIDQLKLDYDGGNFCDHCFNRLNLTQGVYHCRTCLCDFCNECKLKGQEK